MKQVEMADYGGYTVESSRSRHILICGVQFDKELRSGEMSVTDLAPIAVRLGAQGVEYRDVYWQDKAKEMTVVRAQLADLGLTGVYATFTPLFNADAAKQAQLMQDLEDARAIGAPMMRVFRGAATGGSGWEVPMRPAAVRVVERAGQYGIRLAVENHSGPMGSRVSDVMQTIEQLDSPIVGTNVDVANYALTGQDPIAAISQLSPWIIYAHLKDVRHTQEGSNTTYLGNGTLPLKDILASLEATGRTLPMCLEFRGEANPEEEIAKSMRRLAGL